MKKKRDFKSQCEKMSICDMAGALESITEKSEVLQIKIQRLQTKLRKLEACHNTIFDEYENRMNALLMGWQKETFFNDDKYIWK
jgi:hypothetical protein